MSQGRIMQASSHCLKLSNSAVVLTLVGFLLPFFDPLGRPSVGAAEYEISGHETYYLYGGEQAPKVVMRRQFRISVRDCRWLLQTTGAELLKGGVQRVIVATDGTNVYHTTYLDTNALCTITPGIVPRENFSLSSFPWLVYGSSCYLRNATNHLLEPIWTVNAPPKVPTSMSGTWSCFDDILNLPKEITFFSDGVGYANSKGRYAKLRDRPPYDKGHIAAIYEAGKTTNCFGVTVPVTAKLTRLTIRPGGTANTDLDVLTAYELEAEQISPHCSVSDFLPVPTQPTTVNDQRFSAVAPGFVQSVGYQLNRDSHRWPSIAEVRSSPAYHEAVVAQAKQSEQFGVDAGWSLKRGFVTMLLISPVVIGIAALLLKSSKLKTTKQTNEERSLVT